jgi:hypothetical protein
MITFDIFRAVIYPNLIASDQISRLPADPITGRQTRSKNSTKHDELQSQVLCLYQFGSYSLRVATSQSLVQTFDLVKACVSCAFIFIVRQRVCLLLFVKWKSLPF